MKKNPVNNKKITDTATGAASNPSTRGPGQAESVSMFAITLPERAVRSVIGTAGATAREITHAVIPPAIRNTRFWNAAVERSLGILAEGVGNVKLTKKGAMGADVARQAVGSVVDTAALLVFHVSPLWLLAVVHDVASGSRHYLDDVVQELRDRGALEKDIKIDNVDHLLTILERTAGELQTDVDRPPLSVGELRGTVDRIRAAMAEEEPGQVPGEIEQFEREFAAVTKEHGLSPREVSNAMAVSIVSGAKFAGAAASAGAGVAARLFVEKGWRPYRNQLKSIQRMGFARYLGHVARPISDAIITNFDPDTETLTERVVSGDLWRAALQKLQKSKPEKN